MAWRATSTQLLVTGRPLLPPFSAQVLRASSPQWKPVSVGPPCVASSRIIDGLGWFKRRHSPITQSFLRFDHVGVGLKQPQNSLLVTPNNNVSRNQNTLRNFGIVVLGGFTTLAATVYVSHLVTIPYSKMTHFVLLPRWVDMMLGELSFEYFMEEYGGKILPETHPTSVRVTLIAEKVIDAMERALRDKKAWKAPNYALLSCKEALKALWLGKKFTDECRDIDWQVFVVDDPGVWAYCLPDGVIVVQTGRLEYLESDAEIAAIIGHEVTHVVARHCAERIAKIMELDILELLWNKFDMSGDVPEKLCTLHESKKLMGLSKKQEFEADYVGMLLMASAGYDPHAAVTVRDKLAKLEGDITGQIERLSTHPSEKKRVQLLTQAQEEAMALYKDSISSVASTIN